MYTAMKPRVFVGADCNKPDMKRNIVYTYGNETSFKVCLPCLVQTRLGTMDAEIISYPLQII